MATPEGIRQVHEMLAATLSPIDEQRKPAEEFLRKNEAAPGFSISMLEAAVSPEVAPQNRLLAMLYFKNNVVRYWRGMYVRRIQDEEKNHLRGRLLQLFPDLEASSAVHAAEAFATIFRSDTIEANKELLQGLLAPLAQCSQVADPANLQRAKRILIGFKPVVKLWACMPTYYWKRTEKHKLLAEVLPSVLSQLLLPLWNSGIEALASGISPETADRLEVVRMCTVCVRDMLREAPKECPEAAMVVPLAFNALRRVVAVAASLAGTPAEEAMSKTVQSIGKLIALVHTRHPITFLGPNGDLLPQYLDLMASSLEKAPTLAVRGPCMAFIASVVRNPAYRQNTGPPMEGNPALVRLRAARKDEDTAVALAAEGIVTAFFTEARISGLLQFLVMNYFVMSHEDLSDWKEDPESFVLGIVGPRAEDFSNQAQVGESSVSNFEEEKKEAARQRSFKEEAVAEDLVLALITGSTKESIRALTNLYANAKAGEPRQALLLQDACLHALGLGLTEKDVLKAVGAGAELTDWFATVLGPELNQVGADQVVLHRRILWLVGQAAPVLRSDLKVAFCSLILQLVKAPDTDRVVRLTAAGTIATIMEASCRP